MMSLLISILCIYNTLAVDTNNIGSVSKVANCDNVQCETGRECQLTATGAAKCVETIPTITCANVLCAPGSTCIDTNARGPVCYKKEIAKCVKGYNSDITDVTCKENDRICSLIDNGNEAICTDTISCTVQKNFNECNKYSSKLGIKLECVPRSKECDMDCYDDKLAAFSDAPNCPGYCAVVGRNADDLETSKEPNADFTGVVSTDAGNYCGKGKQCKDGYKCVFKRTQCNKCNSNVFAVDSDCEGYCVRPIAVDPCKGKCGGPNNCQCSDSETCIPDNDPCKNSDAGNTGTCYPKLDYEPCNDGTGECKDGYKCYYDRCCSSLSLEPGKCTGVCKKIVCPAIRRKCDDGSYVSPDPMKDCAYDECPTTDPVCDDEEKDCGNGVMVGKNPKNNCEYYTCPSAPCDNPDRKKECPDGTIVTLDKWTCQLPECPKIYCTADAKKCNDGTTKSRDPNNNCEFPDCPEEITPVFCDNTLTKCDSTNTFVTKDALNNCQPKECPKPCEQETKKCNDGTTTVTRNIKKKCQYDECPEDTDKKKCNDDIKKCIDGTTRLRSIDLNCEFKPCEYKECGDDYKKCDDGTIIKRNPKNNCEFDSCAKISCTDETKTCDDVDKTVVRRDPALNCEYTKCPNDNSGGPIVCNDKVFTCPSGVTRERDPNNGCEYKKCPCNDMYGALVTNANGKDKRCFCGCNAGDISLYTAKCGNDDRKDYYGCPSPTPQPTRAPVDSSTPDRNIITINFGAETEYLFYNPEKLCETIKESIKKALKESGIIDNIDVKLLDVGCKGIETKCKYKEELRKINKAASLSDVNDLNCDGIDTDLLYCNNGGFALKGTIVFSFDNTINIEEIIKRFYSLPDILSNKVKELLKSISINKSLQLIKGCGFGDAGIEYIEVNVNKATDASSCVVYIADDAIDGVKSDCPNSIVEPNDSKGNHYNNVYMFVVFIVFIVTLLY